MNLSTEMLTLQRLSKLKLIQGLTRYKVSIKWESIQLERGFKVDWMEETRFRVLKRTFRKEKRK